MTCADAILSAPLNTSLRRLSPLKHKAPVRGFEMKQQHQPSALLKSYSAKRTRHQFILRRPEPFDLRPRRAAQGYEKS